MISLNVYNRISECAQICSRVVTGFKNDVRDFLRDTPTLILSTCLATEIKKRMLLKNK